MENIFAVLLIAIGVTVILFASAFLNAFVLSKLWLWFAVPIFHFSPLSYAQAMGISLLVGFITTHYIKEPEKDSGSSGLIAFMLVRPLVALGIGYIVSFYI